VDKIVSSENIDDQLLLKHDEDGKMIVNIKEEIKNQHISKNMNSIMSKKSVALELGRQNKEVFTKNIPMYMKKYHFSREQIHECYILYKVNNSNKIKRLYTW
jgi:Mg2+ and Co2+ transporter CorA